MANKNEIVKLADGVYQIKYYWLGIANVYAYLIVGDESALLIDTCYSITGIKKYVEQITTLPVDVVNTHGHFDHIGGNAEFKTVYLSKADRGVAGAHSDYDTLRKMINNYEKQNVLARFLFRLKKYKKQVEDSLHIELVEYKDLPVCGFFDLGGRKVSFIETPGHTPGSICLFDEKTKYFFVGDMACEEGVLLGFDYAASVAEYRESILKMQDYYRKHGGKAIIPSHHMVPAREDVFERYIALCDDILTGKLTGKYEDQGLCDGQVVKRDNLQMVYRKIK
mgnify:CR=1 FL=1